MASSLFASRLLSPVSYLGVSKQTKDFVVYPVHILEVLLKSKKK